MKRKCTPPPPRKKGAVRKSKAQMRKTILRLHITGTRCIKWKCRNCTNNRRIEIKECPVLHCALWPLRPNATVSPADLQKWESVFLEDPLNREIMGEAYAEETESKEIVRLDDITFE